VILVTAVSVKIYLFIYLRLNKLIQKLSTYFPIWLKIYRRCLHKMLVRNVSFMTVSG